MCFPSLLESCVQRRSSQEERAGQDKEDESRTESLIELRLASMLGCQVADAKGERLELVPKARGKAGAGDDSGKENNSRVLRGPSDGEYGPAQDSPA